MAENTDSRILKLTPAPAGYTPPPSAPPPPPKSGEVAVGGGGYTPSNLPAGVESVTSGETTVTREGYEVRDTLYSPQPPSSWSRSSMTSEQKYEAYLQNMAAQGTPIVPTPQAKEELIGRLGGPTAPVQPTAETRKANQFRDMESRYGPGWGVRQRQITKTPTFTPFTPGRVRSMKYTPTSVGFLSIRTEEDLPGGRYEVSITPTSIRQTEPSGEFKITAPGEGQVYDVNATAMEILKNNQGFGIISQDAGQVILAKDIIDTQVSIKTMIWGPDIKRPVSDAPVFPSVSISAAPGSSIAAKSALEVGYFTTDAGKEAVGIIKGDKIVGMTIEDLQKTSMAYETPVAYQARMESKTGALGFVTGGNKGAIEYFLTEKAGVERFGPINYYRTEANRYENFIASGGSQSYAPSAAAASMGAAIIRGGLELPMLPATIGIPALKTLQRAAFGEFRGGFDVNVPIAIGAAAVTGYAADLFSYPVETAAKTIVGAGAMGASLFLGGKIIGAAGTSVDVWRGALVNWEVRGIKLRSEPKIIAASQDADIPVYETASIGGKPVTLPKYPGVGVKLDKVAGITADSGKVYISYDYITPLGRRITVFTPSADYVIGGGMLTSYGRLPIATTGINIGGKAIGFSNMPTIATQAGLFGEAGLISGKSIITIGKGASKEVYGTSAFLGQEIPQNIFSYRAANTISPQGGRIIGGATISAGGGELPVTFMYPDLGLKIGEKYVSGIAYGGGTTTPFSQRIFSAFEDPRTSRITLTNALKEGGYVVSDYANIVTFKPGVAPIPSGAAFGTYLKQATTLRVNMPVGTGGMDLIGGSAFKGGMAEVVSFKGVGYTTVTKVVAPSMESTIAAELRQQVFSTPIAPALESYGTALGITGTIVSTKTLTGVGKTTVSVGTLPAITQTLAKTSMSYGGINLRTIAGEIPKLDSRGIERAITLPRTGFFGGTESRTIPFTLPRMDLQTIQRTATRTDLLTGQRAMQVTTKIKTGGGGGFGYTGGYVFDGGGINIPRIPSFGGGFEGRGFGRGFGRSLSYAPSLIALIEGIRGRQPKLLTGLEIRPLGGRLTFGGTSRRRRRKRR